LIIEIIIILLENYNNSLFIYLNLSIRLILMSFLNEKLELININVWVLYTTLLTIMKIWVIQKKIFNEKLFNIKKLKINKR
jgi:hypothetical protein